MGALRYGQHEKRGDGVAIVVDERRWEVVAERCEPSHGAAMVRVDCVGRGAMEGVLVTVVCTHQRGGKAEQLAELFAFADEACSIAAGDFNEEFARPPAAGFVGRSL